MPAFRSMTSIRSADVVVVGGGTVGAWTAVLLAESGVPNVVLIEARTLGDGASSRAAGMVRAQGGTETAIRLGLRTQEFYAASGDRFPLDCGFVAQGYLMPCFTDAEVAQAHDRIALQQTLGLEVQWLSGSDIDDRNTGLAPGVTLGASYAPGDGYIDAPRNVLAYTAALTAHRVDVRERCKFTGLRTAGGRVVGVDTSDGPIDTEHVVLTGGPKLAEGRRDGGRENSCGRCASPGGGHRTGHGVRRARSADGVRPHLRNLLAARRSRRPAVGNEQPGRAAGRGRRFRRDLLPEGPRPDRGTASRRERARAATDVGGDHRLHPRPPADPRPAAHRRRPCRGHRGGQPGGPRHDVGPGGRPGGRRPDRPPAGATGSTSPTSASTDSTPTATVALPPNRFHCRSRRKQHCELPRSWPRPPTQSSRTGDR